MKSTLAAASCKNVVVVIDEIVFVVGLHSLEDLLPLYHAHFTVHCHCRLHAFESLSLVNDRRLNVFAAPPREGIAAG
jgi:hypothetical protein